MDTKLVGCYNFSIKQLQRTDLRFIKHKNIGRAGEYLNELHKNKKSNIKYIEIYNYTYISK